MAGSVILEDEGESIDGVCATVVRVIRRCFPAPPYRPRWPGLLAVFRPCFTVPTFRTFIGLVVGLIAQARRRTGKHSRARFWPCRVADPSVIVALGVLP
jgi:hypothetical protein